MLPSRSSFLPIRGLRHHVREWGAPEAPLVVLLHGWLDVSATFQFVADALARTCRVVAPDWRGFGLSEGQGDAYWLPNYLGDLDALLRVLSPDAPVNLAGHSMGGNMALLYAGLRPLRVRRLAALDAFGLVSARPEDAPGRLTGWLDELAAAPRTPSYPDRAALASRFMRANPRLGAGQAAFLAEHLGVADGQGGIRLAADPAHWRVNPVLYRREEAMACWRQVIAPTLWISPEDPAARLRFGVTDALHDAGKACFRDFREVLVADAGHNLHHDQPGQVARILEEFFLAEQP